MLQSAACSRQHPAAPASSRWRASVSPSPSGATSALDGVDLAIPRGSVYGVLGPNGAGKTTTIRILATLLRPDGGEARVLGHDVVHDAAAVRRRVSLTGQFASVDEDLNAFENLVLLAPPARPLAQTAQRRARTTCSRPSTSPTPRAARSRQLSGGMRRRLDIAASIIVTPDLLFLDEPTTGLDPRSRSHVWEIVRAVVALGTTVLLTTQYLDEADRLADRIAVIDHGRVIAEGTRGELKASVGAGGVRVRLLDPTQRQQAERVLARRAWRPGTPSPIPPRWRRGSRHATRASRRSAWRDALADLSGAGIAISDFALGQPSLDEVFLALTGAGPIRAASRRRRAA